MTATGGFIAVAGRPNAGKSTLLNRIAGSKVTIVSHRRQTTRSVIRHISETPQGSIVWLDTPGWQNQHSGMLNRALNTAAEWAVHIADAIVFLTVAGGWTRADDGLLAKLPTDKKIICAVNKIDCVADKNQLLPIIAELSARRDFSAIIPISGRRGSGVDALLGECAAHLSPRALAMDAAEDYAFFFAELLREKIFRALGDELPYRIGVVADVESVGDKRLNVAADIYVERPSQKLIVIGRRGEKLKGIATTARRDMEKYSGKKIYLTNQVHVADWQRDPQLLRRMKIGIFPHG